MLFRGVPRSFSSLFINIYRHAGFEFHGQFVLINSIYNSNGKAHFNRGQALLNHMAEIETIFLSNPAHAQFRICFNVDENNLESQTMNLITESISYFGNYIFEKSMSEKHIPYSLNRCRISECRWRVLYYDEISKLCFKLYYYKGGYFSGIHYKSYSPSKCKQLH